jgi:ATP-binding cassette subfamily F protein 3
MIRIQGLVLSRGATRLLDRADAAIAAGERIALIGLNGSGKSTLFAALTGELAPDGGSIEQPWPRVTLLRQSPPSGGMPAWRYLLDGDARLCAAEHALAALHYAPSGTEPQPEQQAAVSAPGIDGIALAQAHADWMDAGGADAKPRALALLAGLGFSDGDAQRPVDTLSGGWRMRLNLARALFAPADLLLLDEPTNHLDLDATLWLERWLQRLECTLLVISHDRDFLDRVVKATLHIDEGKLVRYAGGYSEFERLRAERAAQAQKRQEDQAGQAARLQAFINRFRAQATRARQVQSRVKALERMAAVSSVRGLRGIEIRLHDPEDSPDPLLSVESLRVGYESTVVLDQVGLQIRRGARIGILGRNGAGKSTLIRTLVGELPALAGVIHPARTLRIGYFDQQAVERLDPEATPLLCFSRIAGEVREQALRDELGRYGFRGDDVTRPVGSMSGGEKARLTLALIAWRRPQFLVLDEPTNHLDAQTRDSLADAIAGFDGAVVLVSHDRYLLRASVDQLMLVDRGRLIDYDGDLDDYAQWVLRSRENGAANTQAEPALGARASVEAPSLDRREERRQAAQRRAELQALTRPVDAEIAASEQRLARIQGRLAEIGTRLQDSALYNSPDCSRLLEELGRERGELDREQQRLESRWFELQERRETLLATRSD